MELKPYQQRVIDDLSDYLGVLEATHHLGKSFKIYWAERGVLDMDAYKNTVPGVPHVCVKVPTAGGKTYIAVNALKPIFEVFTQRNPKRPKFVVWLVPSLTILEQTVRNLADPEHPYRKRLAQLFQNRVAVFQKSDLLMGAGFSADTVTDQLSVVVMSFDSLRARNKEDRKIYQDNGYLASFLTGESSVDLLNEYDASALINVIRSLRPVVVVDESHNAESALSVEMLVNLNPDFILDLTATPRNNSNIISYVDAMALKKNHMVKLPVIVANRNQRAEVIESALIMRRQLEEIAQTEEARGGRYIRPIVLFQAQPKSADDNTTFEQVKAKLIEWGVPEEQIKIKTAKLNELQNIDLMSHDCPVRYIITVNALKEGWDCPFAYILASLADKSSPVDVEQILGRVLRMPHVKQHGHDLLNMSYVFTASSKFMDTLQSIVRALHRSGFSDKDYRALLPASVDELTAAISAPGSSTAEDLLLPLGALDSAGVGAYIAELPSSPDAFLSDDTTNLLVSPQWQTETITTPFVEALKTQAAEENRAFEAQAIATPEDSVPVELAEKTNVQPMKEIWRNSVSELRLPQFFVKVEPGGFFDDDDTLQLLERDGLLGDFKLANADANISFEDAEGHTYRVDLEKQGLDDYAPKFFKLDKKQLGKFNQTILAGTTEFQVREVTARLVQKIGNMFPLVDADIKVYVTRIVSAFNSDQIQLCLENYEAYATKIQKKIKLLTDIYAERKFTDELDVNAVFLTPSFNFPLVITPKSNAPDISKSLYRLEESMNDFEARIITKIAELENVQWWHRNQSKGKGFRINGFVNHYPDFIVKTQQRIIVVETKGDDRDNSDSEKKIRLGKLWEAKAGDGYRYMMIFESKALPGAENLTNALLKLARL